MARFGQAIRQAAPGWAVALAGSVLWALAMAAAVWLSTLLAGWQNAGNAARVASFFAAGGFFAFAPAIWIGRLLSRGRSDAGFAATFLALATLTVALTAILTAMQYRQYYSTWHDQTLTVRFVFQFVFTTAAAIYQFLVLGLRGYFPFGFVALIAASWWNVTRLR